MKVRMEQTVILASGGGESAGPHAGQKARLRPLGIGVNDQGHWHNMPRHQ